MMFLFWEQSSLVMNLSCNTVIQNYVLLAIRNQLLLALQGFYYSVQARQSLLFFQHFLFKTHQLTQCCVTSLLARSTS